MKKKAKIAFGKLDLLRNDQLNNKNKIKIGFVGGGPNSFIGYTHRLAARFDNRFDFVAGVFSRDKKKSKEFGKSLGLDTDRCYNDYKIMAKKESARPDGVQAIGIMTPSGDHYKIAREFIKS
jgi:predicted dehydrogenase